MRKNFYHSYNEFKYPTVELGETVFSIIDNCDYTMTYTMDTWSDSCSGLDSDISSIEYRLKTAEETIDRLLVEMKEMKDQMQKP